MSAMNTTATAPGSILPPHLLEPVLVRPVLETSIAALACKVVVTSNERVVVPRITDEPTAAWVREGAEISASGAAMEDVAIVPAKLAGLSVISTELAHDSSVDVSGIIGRGLSHDIARKIDAAFFGNDNAPAPKGLEALEGVTTIDSSGFKNLDPFIDAAKTAEAGGFPVTSWVAHPDDVAAISKLKRAEGSAERLIAAVRDEQGSLARVIDGIPLHQSPAVTKGTIWGIPENAALFVHHDGTRIEISDQAFFSSDRIAIRAIMRVAWGFIHPPAIMKITTPAA